MKHELALMTFKELELDIHTKRTIIIPLGSVESHGPHSPLGDYLVVDQIAKECARRTNSLVTPTIPFSYSDYFRSVPGTISLAFDTMRHLLFDVIESLVTHNIQSILILNGHSGNEPIIDLVARDIRKKHQIIVGSINIWKLSDSSQVDEDEGAIGHGGEPLTSIMTFLYPEAMRFDLIDEHSYSKPNWHGHDIKGVTTLNTHNHALSYYLDIEDIASNSLIGYAKKPCPDKGQKILQSIIDEGLSVISLFKNLQKPK